MANIPQRRPVQVALEPGDEAFLILQKPIGKRGTRWEVTGVARVRVDATEEDLVQCTVLLSKGHHMPGYQHVYRRWELYAEKSKVEMKDFMALVEFLWGEEARKR